MSQPNERQEKLTSIWELTAAAVVRLLSSDDPSASAVDAARKFLSDNGCTLDTLRDWRRGGLGFVLPTFEDDPGSDEDNGDQSGGAAPLADPLRQVPPFADAE